MCKEKFSKRVKSNYWAACLPVGKGIKKISLDAAVNGKFVMKIENLLAKEKSLGVSTPRSAPDSCEYRTNTSPLSLPPYLPRGKILYNKLKLTRDKLLGRILHWPEREITCIFNFLFLIFPTTPSETLKISLLITLPLHLCFLIKAILFEGSR